VPALALGSGDDVGRGFRHGLGYGRAGGFAPAVISLTAGM
jgi:hypothetical protein